MPKGIPVARGDMEARRPSRPPHLLAGKALGAAEEPDGEALAAARVAAAADAAAAVGAGRLVGSAALAVLHAASATGK